MTTAALRAVTVLASSPVALDAVLTEIRCAARTDDLHVDYLLRIDGVPELAAREARTRVRSALSALGLYPEGSVTAELSPAPTSTPQLDLAIAIGVLAAAGVVPPPDGLLVLGELGLDGSTRGVRGALAASLAAHASGLRGVLLPVDCAWEASLVEGLAVYPVASLAEAIAVLRGTGSAPGVSAPHPRPEPHRGQPDFAEIRGQSEAARALALAVTQGEDVLLLGPPGNGKTRLARRVSSLLPDLTHDERLQVIRAYSAAGLASSASVADGRPFRAPHASISPAALVGEVGPTRRPGELQLAGHGVLYLDDLPEFSGATLAALAAALARATPGSRPRVVASATTCPCGWSGQGKRMCTCSEDSIRRHQVRVQHAAQILGLRVTVGVSGSSSEDAPCHSSAELRAYTHAAQILKRSALPSAPPIPDSPIGESGNR